MSKTEPHKIPALFSAILLWLALNAIVALPVLQPRQNKAFPIYVAGALLLLEPLICFWAYYQYRYMLRGEPKSHHRDDLDV